MTSLVGAPAGPAETVALLAGGALGGLLVVAVVLLCGVVSRRSCATARRG